jgi:hypothetical protein
VRIKFIFSLSEININIAIDPGNKLGFYRNQSNDEPTPRFQTAKRVFVKAVCQLLFINYIELILILG